jgi:tetratricopeptide (TPR) repeat protein
VKCVRNSKYNSESGLGKLLMQELEHLDGHQLDSMSSDPLFDDNGGDEGADYGRSVGRSTSSRARHTAFKFFGSTAQVPFPEVLKEIALQELSGDLQVISGPAIRTLYFNRGFIVFASSNLKRDRLGQRLLQSGKVTERELEMACQMMKGRKRIGEAMIAAGLLSEEELGQEVARQSKRIVLSTYSMKNGIYSFDERHCSIPMELRLGFSIYGLQLEGIRRMTNGRLILQGLGSLLRRLRCSELPPFTVEEADLRPIERKVISATTKGGALGEMAKSVGEDKGKVLRASYGLLCAGILEYADMAPRELKVQEETETFLLSSLDKSEEPSPAINVRQEVLLQFDALERATPDELLDVDESADDETIAQAYENQRQEWEKKQSLIDSEKSLYIKVEEIKRRLAAAHEAMLGKGKLPPLEGTEGAGAELEEEEFEFEFEIDEEIDAAAAEPADLDFDTSEDPVAVSDAPPSETVVELIEEKAPPAERVETIAVSPEPETGSTIPPGLMKDSKEKLKGILYDLKVRKAVNDAEGAISLMYELVELVPDNSKYEVMLAQALAKHPVMCKRAERHFRRALSLDPQNADYHYRMGLYYKSFNMKSRALAEFKTALRIAPTHSKARSGLVDLKKDSSSTMEKVFKKILG